MKLQKLHSKYNKYPTRKFIVLSHQYDVKLKTWRFIGYRCKHCSKPLKDLDLIEQHESVCRSLAEKVKLPTIPEIITTEGQDWKPIVDLGIIPI